MGLPGGAAPPAAGVKTAMVTEPSAEVVQDQVGLIAAAVPCTFHPVDPATQTPPTCGWSVRASPLSTDGVSAMLKPQPVITSAPLTVGVKLPGCFEVPGDPIVAPDCDSKAPTPAKLCTMIPA